MRSFPWDSIIIGKNEEYGYPIIDRPSSADDLRELYKTFFSNGVFMDNEDSFFVIPEDGMNVIVSGGKCGINGTIGYESAMRVLALQASSSLDRIDTIVLRWNNNVEMRSIDLYVKTGVASATPVRPKLTRSESVWELGIADIFVAKNSGAISAARITDTRLDTSRCGAVTPFMQLDTTTFFNQIQAAIDERTAELEKQTAKAVELAQNAIDGTTAGNLQSQIDANKAVDDERWDILSRYSTLASSDGRINALRIGNIVYISHNNRAIPALDRYAEAKLFDLGDGFIPQTIPFVPVVVNGGFSGVYAYVNEDGLYVRNIGPTAMASAAGYFSLVYVAAN